jgi:hypothetical protein
MRRLCEETVLTDLLETDVDKVPHLVAEDPGGEARRRLVHNVLQQLEYGHRLVHSAYSSSQCCGSGSGIRCLFDPGPGSGIGFFFRIPDPNHIFFRAL